VGRRLPPCRPAGVGGPAGLMRGREAFGLRAIGAVGEAWRDRPRALHATPTAPDARRPPASLSLSAKPRPNARVPRTQAAASDARAPRRRAREWKMKPRYWPYLVATFPRASTVMISVISYSLVAPADRLYRGDIDEYHLHRNPVRGSTAAAQAHASAGEAKRSRRRHPPARTVLTSGSSS